MKNKRKHPRFTIKAVTEVFFREEDSQISAYVGGISRGGLELYSKEPVKQGARLMMQLHFLDKAGMTQSEEVEGEVRWSAPFQDNYISGIQFNAVLDQNQNPNLINYLNNAEGYTGGS